MTRSATTQADNVNRKQRRTREALERRGIQVIEIPEGELRPMFIKASHVPRLILGVGKGHLANLRACGAGPKYYVAGNGGNGGAIYYRPEDLEAYFGAHLVETTNQPIPVKQFEVEETGEEKQDEH